MVQWQTSGNVKQRFVGHSSGVKGALVDPMWGLISWGSQEFIQWDANGNVKLRFVGHNSGVKGVFVDPTWGLISWDSNGELIRWHPSGIANKLKPF
jgi:hypothetical protein